MNTAIFFANTNCCGMSGMYGTDRIHIDPFNTGRRCVPFSAEKRLPGCTRAHALRWQITPRWGWMQRHPYQDLHTSLADYAPLGLDASDPAAEIESDGPQERDVEPL